MKKHFFLLKKNLKTYKNFYVTIFMVMVVFSLAGCRIEKYPIDSEVVTTDNRTISFTPYPIEPGLLPHELSNISQYVTYGYGDWTFGPGLPSDPRLDNATQGIMQVGYVAPALPHKAKLLNFFAMTDVHMTDKESPSQLIYLQQLYYPNLFPPPLDQDPHYPWSWQTSIYSPVMLYTTQVLDAAVQTVNALHQQNSFDFGISLGDVANSSQYNELRWYIDVLDGKVITPSSGAHDGACTIDYQKPYKAAGLDKTIPWYQCLGNHDHFWTGSFPVNIFLRQSYISDTVIAVGDVLLNTLNINSPNYYMGVIDGSTPYGDIVGAGPVVTFTSSPKVVADPDRRSVLRTEFINEFFTTTSNPIGHGFNLVDQNQEEGFACYSFVPKSAVPIKVIVLDDTQNETDGDTGIHGHGFLDAARWTWLKNELAAGDADDQLMIIAAHIPIGVQDNGSNLEWWTNAQNAVQQPELIAELESHPNLLLWISGHRHYNTVKAFVSTDPAHPENGFWQVETSSLRDYPQQFRTFEIYLNSDYTISIVTTDVDPAVKEGTPAAISRKYAVAAQQIVNNDLGPNWPGSDPTIPGYPNVADPTIKSMLPSYSYNATLYKQLSLTMKQKMQGLFP